MQASSPFNYQFQQAMKSLPKRDVLCPANSTPIKKTESKINKKVKTLLVSLGVSAIIIFSFANLAMAAGYGGGTTRTMECQLDGECIEQCEDPIQTQQRLGQAGGQAGDQIRDRLQDCTVPEV